MSQRDDLSELASAAWFEFRTGTSSSCLDIITTYLDTHAARAANIESYYVLYDAASKQSIVLIGETHGTLESEMTADVDTFAQFLQRQSGTLCQHFDCDLFIESSWALRHVGFDEVDPNMDGTMQAVARVASSYIPERVHCVDVRDGGFIRWMMSCDSDKNTFRFTNLLNILQLIIPDDNPYVAVDDIVRVCAEYRTNVVDYDYLAMSGCAEFNYHVVCELITPHVQNITNEQKKKFIDIVLSRTKNMIDVPYDDENRHMRLWNAVSSLNDVYTVAQMLRDDAANVCIFYGGSNHVEKMKEWFHECEYHTINDHQKQRVAH